MKIYQAMDKRSKRDSVSRHDRINDNPSTVQRKGHVSIRTA